MKHVSMMRYSAVLILIFIAISGFGGSKVAALSVYGDWQSPEPDVTITAPSVASPLRWIAILSDTIGNNPVLWVIVGLVVSGAIVMVVARTVWYRRRS